LSFSEDNTLGSPIHRTEEKFNAEEIDTEHKPIKRGARLDRLAALASTINNWEDDLSHPILNLKVFYNIYFKRRIYMLKYQPFRKRMKGDGIIIKELETVEIKKKFLCKT